MTTDPRRGNLRPAAEHSRPTPLSPDVRSTPALGGYPLEHSSLIVQDAVDDLARRLDVDRSQITVIEAQGVTWPNSALGCPQPGMGYLDVLADGARALLEAVGHRYEYRGGTRLSLCTAWAISGETRRTPPRRD